jgi:uncharacterized alkaline shock family protein YloU
VKRRDQGLENISEKRGVRVDWVLLAEIMVQLQVLVEYGSKLSE